MDILIGRAPDLAKWERRAMWPQSRPYADFFERVVAHEPPGPPQPGGPHRRVEAAILRYDIHGPPLTPVLRRAPVEIGDTVGALYRILPGVDLFFASRVIEKFDGVFGEVWRSGFAYRTIPGHPEMGEEAFVVEKSLRTGEVTTALRSWSSPGTNPGRFFPFVLRFVQVRANHRALDHLEGIAQ